MCARKIPCPMARIAILLYIKIRENLSAKQNEALGKFNKKKLRKRRLSHYKNIR
jgi:hypothetical protein